MDEDLICVLATVLTHPQVPVLRAPAGASEAEEVDGSREAARHGWWCTRHQAAVPCLACTRRRKTLVGTPPAGVR